ncbi:hypothetical protein [Sphingomonas sp.]|uniref:hypothetical protein n=1 Tax=Sphingomonas sp. TaxID=28214 RepID=UPI001B1DF682|nr:hypothetical protein [Sphingomonas sp.]MBO9713588.1 hypothetical protein [Sphingomonas sp.]
MAETVTLKLTVYSPEIMTDGQSGFDYDLTIEIPDTATSFAEGTADPGDAKCEVVPVTGTLSFPNPAAPVIAPFTGLIFIYSDSYAIGFPLTMIAQGDDPDLLPFNLNMAFPASPLYFYSGAIQFGQWPGPLSDTTASFLCPQ